MKSFFSRMGRHHHVCDAPFVVSGHTAVCADGALYPMYDRCSECEAAKLKKRESHRIKEAHA